MSYSFKSILVTALLTFSVSVQASLPNSNIEDSPTPRSSPSLTSPVSLNAPLPIHLKVLNGLLEQVEAEELAGTPDLNSLMDSYSASRGKALPLPVLLHRLTRELERTPSTMQGYDAFFKQTYLKGFYALYIFLNYVPGATQDSLYNWKSLFSILKEKSKEIEDYTPVFLNSLNENYNFEMDRHFNLFEKHLFSAIQPFCPEKTLSVAKLIAIRIVKPLEIGILGEVSRYAQNIFLSVEAGKIPQESYFFLQIHHAYFLSVIGGAFHDRGHLSKAERWLKKAAEKREYQFKELPMYYLWVACRDQGKHIEAKEWLRKAAENGSDRGMYDLGTFYEREGDLSNAKKLYEQAASQELKEAIAALGNLYYVQGNFDEAINWYEAAASQGHVMSMNNLGSIYFSRGEESKAISLFEQAATFNNKEAICNLGISYMKRGETKEAIQFLTNALMLGQSYAALLLAEILPESELEQKEALYKQAIENGLDGALALYVSFLMKTKGYDEAHEYEEFMDVSSDLSETDLETSEESSGPEADFEQFPREENKEVVETEEKTPSLTLPTSHSEGEANVFYGQYEQKEKFQIPSLSKRTLREIERAKKKQSQPSFSSSAEKTSYRTFRDITVLVDPDAESEVKACSYKVKNLLSSLANGEGRRGNLKLLQGQDDLYSMRITRSDRLVFRILEGNLKTGIKRLQILCAKGHYSALNGARLSRDEKSCERL